MKVKFPKSICEAYVDEYSEPSPLIQDCIHVWLYSLFILSSIRKKHPALF